jgi:hypothetical protein
MFAHLKGQKIEKQKIALAMLMLIIYNLTLVDLPPSVPFEADLQMVVTHFV